MDNKFFGKILNIDLSTKKIIIIDFDIGIAKKYLGGLGFCVKTMYDEIGSDVDAFSEKNIVVLSPGPMNGTSATATGRAHIATKSPITGIIGMGNFGGAFGIRLRKAGFEGVIIRGKSTRPVYLLIDNQNVKIKDASHLWGKDTYETINLMKKEFGSEVSVLCIGQAGENLVKFANTISDYYHASGRSSVGCVMGDKKIKAIVVRGTNKIHVVDKIKFQDAVIEAMDRIIEYPDKSDRRKVGSHSSRFTTKAKAGTIRSGNFANHELPKDHDFFKLPLCIQENTMYRQNSFGENCIMAHYYGCDLEADVRTGPYIGTNLAGIGFSNLGWDWGVRCGIKNYPAMFKCKELCNKYGMDTGSPIPFAMELLEKGVISKDDLDGIELTVGNEEAIMKMLRKIAYREGFGNILAEGTAGAARLIGKGAEKYALTIKGKQILEPDVHAMGVARVLGMATCARGGDDLTSTHTINDIYSYPDWAVELGWSKKKYLSWLINYIDMFPEEKEKIYGSPDNIEFLNTRSYEGKARLVVWFENITSIVNSIGLCIVTSNMAPALGPTHMAKLYSAATGLNITPRELMKAGERIFNLMKAYNVREGLTRKNDYFPERSYNEPLSSGPDKGMTMVEREPFEKLLDEYYSIRGWDVKTSIPTKEKLMELGLEEIAKTLHQ